MTSPLRVFISYSHDSAEHRDRVLGLAENLRDDGVDVHLDQYEVSPPQGWPQWMLDQIELASFVLVVCTETYHQRFRGKAPVGTGRGVKWEGAVLSQTLYDADSRNERFIPVVFTAADADHIPVVLRGASRYVLADADGYESLYRHLTGQPAVLKGDLGRPRTLPPRKPRPMETPKYESAEVAAWSAQLKAAIQRKKDLLRQGGDVTAVQEEIRQYQRQLREGPQLKAGDHLGDGRFELLDLIGEGGFASVWRAWDEEATQLVAVKVLHGQHARDHSRRQRFFRGAHRMAELNHSGIVRVIEAELEDGGHPFFVMEHLPGGDLQQAVLSGQLAPKQCLEIIMEVGEALEFAHSHGVIHRDVKPHNILLDADSHPHLTDFDLARALDASQGTRSSMLGTAIYAAPELLERPQDAGPPADVFGLGMTALFALHGANLTLAAFRDTDAFVNRLSAPEDVKAVLRRAVVWEIEERWRGTGELVKALRECQLLREAVPGEFAIRSPDLAPAQTLPPTLPVAVRQSHAEEKSKSSEPAWKVWLAAGLVVLLIVLVGYQAAGRKVDPLPAKLPAGLPAAPQAAKPIQERENPMDKMVLVSVPGGEYPMGSNTITDAEKPPHTVRLSPFWIGKYEVTNEQYARFLAANPSQRKPEQWTTDRYREPQQPVVGVSWEEASAYCVWAGLQLPTEAQWEAAARGSDGRKYPWGNGPKPTVDLTAFGKPWLGGRSEVVGSKPRGAGPFGTLDQAGNVWEWCSDVWNRSAYSNRDGTQNPFEEGGNPAVRVVRGGSWADPAGDMRAAYRYRLWTDYRDVDVGFRCVTPSGPEP